MVDKSGNRHDDDRSCLSVVQLFLRISAEHIRCEQKKRKQRLLYTSLGLLVYIFLIWLVRYDNQIYNIYKGPFHTNRSQLIQYIEYENQPRKYWQRNFFSYYENYFQIELGENHIVKYGTHPFLKLVIEPVITTSIAPYHLYVKLPTQEQSYYHIHLPFDFQLFSIRTLKCIVRQLKFSANDYHTWLEKSLYVRTIEQSYAKNPTLFNANVLSQCGILIGYLYHPRSEYQLIETTSTNFPMNSFDVAIDASYSYSLIVLILVCIILSGLLIKISIDICKYMYHYIHRSQINIHSKIQDQLRILGIHSLDSLTDLLYESVLQSLNYHHDMFIIEDKYLVMFKIDLDEYNAQKLRMFYYKCPFSVVSISSIIEIRDFDFLINDGHEQQHIYFSVMNNEIQASRWLHEQLMLISADYQNRYAAIVQYEQERERERYARQFALILGREEELQRRKTVNNLDRMLGIVKSASPRFIAQFCLTDHPVIQHDQIDLLNNQCSICLDQFRFANRYAQWPCPAQHYFHCKCMLEVLRESNKCPLCRYSVESAPSFFQNMSLGFF